MYSDKKKKIRFNGLLNMVEVRPQVNGALQIIAQFLTYFIHPRTQDQLVSLIHPINSGQTK